MAENTNEVLILMENVQKVFMTDEVETHALAGIHLQLKRGEFVAINGPSGCGKSTLLSILGLLDSPSDGNYTINNKPVSNLSLSERTRIRNREIGFIFQAFNLIGDLNVYENVELPLTYRGMGSAERKQRHRQNHQRHIVVFRKPDHEPVAAQIRRVMFALGSQALRRIAHQHPDEVRPPLAIARRMRIAVLIGKLMRNPMRCDP